MIKGIDVSRWQGKINFKVVKDSGIEFVIIRCGTSWGKDVNFEENYKAAKEQGLKVGVYWYTYALDESDVYRDVTQIKTILNGKELDLPIFYDVEDETILKTGTGNIKKLINTFIDLMNGRNIGLYASKAYLEAWKAWEFDIPIWVAQWNDECTYKHPYIMWQYSSKGRVPEIDGNVDLDYLMDDNYFNKKKPEVKDDLSKYTDLELAQRVLKGEYGNGQIRKDKLGKRYTAVQKIVNNLIIKNVTYPEYTDKELANMVIKGKFGNGRARKNALKERYKNVQALVNKMI